MTLLPIAAGAVVLRFAYAVAVAPDLNGLTDDSFYRSTAFRLAAGQGFGGGLEAFYGNTWPTAAHPPLYPLVLSVLPRLRVEGVDAMRSVNVLLGGIAVLVTGLVAGRLGGRRAAIVAASICAVFPPIVAADGTLMAETLFGVLVMGAVLATLVAIERPSAVAAAGIGVLVGAAALSRSEGLLLAPLLATALAIAAPGRRLRLAAVIGFAALVVVSPWVIRNWHTFGRPLFTTNEGTTLQGANCHETYYGASVGGFTADCLTPGRHNENPAVTSERRRRAAWRYARRHGGRAAVVAGVRLLRLWTLYDLKADTRVEGRDKTLQVAGIVLFYPLVAAGGWGAVVLQRRRRTLALAVALTPVVVSCITAATTYGLPRLRHIVDLSLIAVAGPGLAALRLRPARGRPSRSRRSGADRA